MSTQLPCQHSFHVVMASTLITDSRNYKHVMCMVLCVYVFCVWCVLCHVSTCVVCVVCICIYDVGVMCLYVLCVCRQQIEDLESKIKNMKDLLKKKDENERKYQGMSSQEIVRESYKNNKNTTALG